ncbi:helix-turn-helix domain-containing protein [Paenibacillus senegalimassiliensis]|uniref:helix-turn-helix domain-containing protein n=1 Tax=Paenibacillus senegalimassiliensis TaxID=1737426 RepID=UPI00073E77DF|nr:helix-turn-helix transcriptional regulator [Paenibacillus senegalimassiliensis]
MSEYKITWTAARVNAGYTLKEVADISKRSIDTVHRYEKDSSGIPLDLMNLWVDLYKVPPGLVFCGRKSDLIGNMFKKDGEPRKWVSA